MVMVVVVKGVVVILVVVVVMLVVTVVLVTGSADVSCYGGGDSRGSVGNWCDLLLLVFLVSCSPFSMFLLIVKW